jgi:hypothetical protein
LGSSSMFRFLTKYILLSSPNVNWNPSQIYCRPFHILRLTGTCWKRLIPKSSSSPSACASPVNQALFDGRIRIDDEIYEDTMATFPELGEEPYTKLIKIDEDWMKSADGKKRWRDLCERCVARLKPFGSTCLTMTTLQLQGQSQGLQLWLPHQDRCGRRVWRAKHHLR